MTPKRENVRFFPSAAAAQAAGFRACRRCRPDAVPGSAEWNLRADVIGRAMRLINDGVIDREGVTGLAARLGYSERQVQRHLVAELGAGPLALARAQRAHTARVLLQTTSLAAADVAFAAGFSSVRQFNDTIREVYASTPRDMRSSARKIERGEGIAGGVGVPLRLAYREPYDRGHIFDFICRRAVPGIEEMLGERGDRVYHAGPLASRTGPASSRCASGAARSSTRDAERGWSAGSTWPTCATSRRRSGACAGSSTSTPIRSPWRSISPPIRCSARSR